MKSINILEISTFFSVNLSNIGYLASVSQPFSNCDPMFNHNSHCGPSFLIQQFSLKSCCYCNIIQYNLIIFWQHNHTMILITILVN